MRIGLEITGIAEFRAQVEAASSRVRKMETLAKAICRRLRACFAENFNAEGRPERWAALEPSTLAVKQQLYDAGMIRGRRRGVRIRMGQRGGAAPGILIRSGELKDSVVRAHTKGNIERIRNGGQEIEVGSSLPHANVHDQGGDGPYTIMPKAGKVLAFVGIDRKTGQPGIVFTRGPIRHPGMKRRSFLVITEETWDLIQNDVQDYLAMDYDGRIGARR